MARDAYGSDSLNSLNTALTTLVSAATTARAAATTAAGGSHDSTPELVTVQTAITAIQTAITAQIKATRVVVDVDLAAITTRKQLEDALDGAVKHFVRTYGLK